MRKKSKSEKVSKRLTSTSPKPNVVIVTDNYTESYDAEISTYLNTYGMNSNGLNGKMEFNDNDELEGKRREFDKLTIFTKLCGKQNFMTPGYCYICKAIVQKSDKILNCDFCGNQLCKRHFLKNRRANPEQNDTNANICTKCESNFLEKKLQSPYWKKNEAIKKLVTSNEKKCENYNQKINSINKELYEIKTIEDTKKRLYDSRMVELTWQKQNLAETIDEIKQEIENKIRRENEKDEQISQMVSKIKILQDEFNQQLQEDTQLRDQIVDIDSKNRESQQFIAVQTLKMANLQNTSCYTVQNSLLLANHSPRGKSGSNEHRCASTKIIKGETIFGNSIVISNLNDMISISNSNGSNNRNLDHKIKSKKYCDPCCII